jgi:hypothetical protein
MFQLPTQFAHFSSVVLVTCSGAVEHHGSKREANETHFWVDFVGETCGF